MQGFLMLLGSVLLIVVLYMGIKHNKEAFSLINMNKSLLTMGILGLLLIMLVTFAVLALR